MKAIVQTRYGDPTGFELQDLPKSEIRKPDDVLIRVHAVSLTAGDLFMMRGVPYFTRLVVGFPKPRTYVPGFDVAGTIEAAGEAVTDLTVGDSVFGSLSHTCAEFVVASASKIERAPANLPLEHAGAIPMSGIAALHGIRDVGRVKPGMSVLVNGASGGVGTFAVQIAKAYGAQVTGVCSTAKMDLVRSLGADHVIDYTKDDFTKGERRYDVILDNAASHSLSDCRRVLTPNGLHIPNSGHSGMPYIIKAMIASMFVRQQAKTYVATTKPGDLAELRELVEAGKVSPAIDRMYKLDKISQAFAHLDEGRARGKILIQIDAAQAA